MYVALTLCQHEWLKGVLPCGVGDCDAVLKSPLSKVFGVPIALFGVFAYLALTALAVQQVMNFNPVRAAYFGIRVALAGSAISVLLTAYSVLALKQVCIWCIASATIFCLTSVAYLLPRPEVGSRSTGGGKFVAIALALWVSTQVTGYILLRNPRIPYSEGGLAKTSRFALAATTPCRLGSRTPKVVVIVFGDLTCPECRRTLPRFIEGVSHLPDCALLYRNLPLKGHRWAREAAVLAVAAAEERKFVEFANAVYAIPEVTMPALLDAAQRVGLGRKACDAVLTRTSRQSQQVKYDLMLARHLGLHVTPSVILLTDKSKAVCSVEDAKRALGLLDSM